MIRPSYSRVGTRDLTGGISDALTNTYNMLNANDQQRTAEARQAAADAQNKQLFDLKIAEVDRANKDREALIQFNKGVLQQPQLISGLITDNISDEQVAKMEFTGAELKEYNDALDARKKELAERDPSKKIDFSKIDLSKEIDLSKLSPSTRAKAELQMKLSNSVDSMVDSPEYQETAYQQAKRIANSIELTPSVLEELKKYQVADIAAQKESKKEGATYAAEAKELETQIAKLRTKQGSIYDNAAGVGTEWGKNSTGGYANNKVNADNMLKYSKMVKETDSSGKLQGMIQEVFMNPGIPNNQKEAIAANIVMSSGATLPQGLLDFGKLNVSVEAAQKATNDYLENLKNGVYGSGNRTSINPVEAQGIENEIALLEARRAGALAKANAYSVDRSTAAKNSIKARMDELFGKKPTASSGGTYATPKAKVTDDSTKKPENVNTEKPYVEAPYIEELLEKVKTPKEKEKVSMDINKLTELYKSKGGTGGSAGLFDDATIRREADKLSRELKIPSKKIVETIRSKARQETLIEGRDKIIATRMAKDEMDKLRNDASVKKAYSDAWREEAKRRGYMGSARPFSLDEFIKRTYSDKLKYN